MQDVSKPVAIIIVVLFVAVMSYCGFLIYNCSAHGSCGSSYSDPQPVNSAPAAKPETLTRCDYTGVLASQIISDEAKDGYVFAGRVSTFLCGNNGLSFYLRPGGTQ